MKSSKPILVVGLGNPLMADEGIGVVLLERLEALAGEGKIPHAERIQFHDGGTGGMNLLHVLAGRQKAVLIDCARMGTEPGTIHRFTPDQVQTVKKLAHLSLHEVDILKVLDISRQLGECPQEVVFFGIEPFEICQRMSLSDLLENQIPRFLQTLLAELNGSFVSTKP
jgi:hydrogenase maturation protease